MKYIQTRFMLCAMFVLSPIAMSAQEFNETDSISGEKERLVQVAYRAIAESDLLGGVSVVDVEELMKKNHLTYSLDNMQGYVGGWNGSTMWGMNEYLVLVDGIPRAPNNVLPTEVDHVTFLKGAQAVVLYGSRAAKGVILITTKRGKTEGINVNVRGNTMFMVAKSHPEFLGSAEYMTLYNEARRNDGLSPQYSDTDIYNYASGRNPYRFPDINFYSSEFIRKVNNYSDVSAEITGGGKRAHFYSNVGYYRQDDVYKFGEAKNANASRLNIRGNVDVNISNDIKAYINATAAFYDSKGAKGNYWQAAAEFRPNRIAPLIPISMIDPNALSAMDLANNTNIIDGKYILGGTQSDPTNIFADMYAAGSTKLTSRQFYFDTGVDINLGKAVKGLSFQAKYAVDYTTTYITSFDNKYSVYEPTWSNYNGEDVIVALKQHNKDEKPGTQNISASGNNQTMAFSGQFNYRNTFNQVHNVTGMLVAAAFRQSYSGVYHRTGNANLALQLGYDYMNKYYVDFGGTEMHSAKLAKEHRNAFSPSLTLGWRLSKESFLEHSTAVDDLMLSVSGSILHQDIDVRDTSSDDASDFNLYKSSWNQEYGWSWYDGSLEKYTKSMRGDNNHLVLVQRREVSVNLRTSLWNKLITADASFFVNTMKGIVAKPIDYPSYFATGYPNASFMPFLNYNDDRRIGFDFNVKLNKRVGEVDLSLGVAGTYFDTKATKRGENNEFAYQNREGRPLDAIWGLKSAGLFQSQEEIDNSPEQKFGGTVKPGDIKYIDQNGDDKIDYYDEVFLGKFGWYGAPFTMGVNFTAKWKAFTFFALGTGSFGAYGMKSSTYHWVYGDRKYSSVVRDRWTEETKATATYPRLTVDRGSNNFRYSDFWMYKTDRFNIAKIQLTYDLPKRYLQNTFFSDFSAYISGANLLTISKESKLLELNVGSAPQTRAYNIGVKAVF